MSRFLSPTLFVLSLFVVGCTMSVNPQTGLTQGRGNISTQDLQTLQKQFMGSYYASSGGKPSVARTLVPYEGSRTVSDTSSRATVPIHNGSAVPITTFSTLVSNSPSANTIGNYPEPGQTTVFSVVLYDGSNSVYKIQATTTFPSGDSRQSYLEEYYVKDIGPGTQGDKNFVSGWNPADGQWTVDDPIVKPASPWTWDQNYRAQIVVTFDDGTTRSETIVSGNNGAISGKGGVADPHFAPFAVGGSLDLSQQFVPTITSDSSIKFSSVVVYETHPATNPNFWFWSGSQAQTIVGIRYYTEQDSGSVYTGTSISFEKTVSSNTTTGGSYATALATLVGGSTFDTLAESVLREQIQWPVSNGNPVLSQATVTKNMQTRVVNITGLSSFYVAQLNSDYAAISDFSNTAAYAPVSAVEEVLADDSDAAVFTGNTITSGVAGALPLATQTVSSSLGALGAVYTGLYTGAVASTPTTTVPNTNVMPANQTWSFGGQQVGGNTVTASVPNEFDLGTTGYVEAWIYINAMTDTMGIVHYGEQVDFSDESYSLQGWGNNGQIAMIVNSASGVYDSVLSKTLLATGKWYQVVGVWDVTLGNKSYINLYINGKLDKGTTSLSSIKPNGSQAPTVNLERVLIGSQLPSIYSTQYGYFGMNGKIVGVTIDTPAVITGIANPTAAQVTSTVLARYNASKDSTAGW